MRTIAHLGNLFVGWTSPSILSTLADTVHRLQPDLVVLSGNLTHAGSTADLKQAKQFLDSLPSPQVVVPGEKDISTGAIVSRLLTASDGFSKIIERRTVPFFADSEMVVVGVNTALSQRGLKTRIAESEREEVDRILETADPSALRVLVSFHPLFLDHFQPNPNDERVFRSVFDIQLAGPLDPPEARKGFRPSDTAVLVSCSNRPEAIGFNLLRVHRPELVLERYQWQNDTASFRLSGSEALPLCDARWSA